MRSVHVGVAVVVALAALGSAVDAAAALYRCIDGTGASVLTDSPVQLQQCEPLDLDLPDESDPRGGAPAPRPATVPGPGVLDDPPADPSATARMAARRAITVPVERLGNLLIVSTTVNGSRPTRLILDTGASHTILSPAVAIDLGLYGDPRGQLVTLRTAGGPVQAEIVPIESIQIAGAEVKDSLAAIYDLPDVPTGVDGLLGLTFLGHFQVTLDTAKGLLHLSGAE